MPLREIFPTFIYDVDLDPPDDVREKMVKSVDDFYWSRREHPENHPDHFDHEPFIGDHMGDSNIASKKEFSWLNEQLSIHVMKYLEGTTARFKDLSVYVQKSWPIVCPREGGTNVPMHIHNNAALSACFYLQCDEENPSQNIHFTVSEEYHPQLLIPVKYDDVRRYREELKIKQSKLVIFPAFLLHGVSTYGGYVDRYSIAYDISLVCENEYYSENQLADPNLWVKI